MHGSVKSACRVFEVLELYAQRRVPLTATDVGRALGYPSSSVAVLLKSMMGLGYLTFDPRQHQYLPSSRVSDLGRWIEPSIFGRAEVIGLLRALSKATGEMAVLSAQCDLQMVILHCVQADGPRPVRIECGRAVPVFRSTVGLAQLSTMADYEIEMLRERASEHGAAADAPPETRLLRLALGQVRRRGYASGYGLVESALGILAIPLNSLLGGSQYVVSIGVPCARMREREVDFAQRMREVLMQQLKPRPIVTAALT